MDNNPSGWWLSGTVKKMWITMNNIIMTLPLGECFVMELVIVATSSNVVDLLMMVLLAPGKAAHPQ